MTDMTPEIVADELKHQLMPVPLAARPILLEAIAELWRHTEGGKNPLAQEARFRANEAMYLADLLH